MAWVPPGGQESTCDSHRCPNVHLDDHGSREASQEQRGAAAMRVGAAVRGRGEPLGCPGDSPGWGKFWASPAPEWAPGCCQEQGTGLSVLQFLPKSGTPGDCCHQEYSHPTNSWQDTSARNLLSKKTASRCHCRINCWSNVVQTAQSLDYFTGSPSVPCRASLGPYVLLSFPHNERNWELGSHL